MSNKKQSKPSIFIRADASLGIGIGHIMRTLAFAYEAKKDDIEIYYLCYSLPTSLQKKIDKVATLISLTSQKDAQEISNLAKQYKPFAIILDSYALDSEYETILKASTDATIVAYEDLDNIHNSDITINPNIYAHSKKKNHLYGSQWAIIRKEFKEKFRAKNSIFTLTVTLGGSDAENITLDIIRSLKKWHISFVANIILGATNPHRYTIYKTIKNANNFKLYINPNNFAFILGSSDLIISASGQTTIEILELKKPSIAITVADNQKRISKTLDEQKLALTLDKSNIKQFLRKLNILYIHQNRYKHNYLSIAKSSLLKEIKRVHLNNFTLSEFKQSDCDELLELANDENVRKVSLSSNLITKEQHNSWCQKKLNDSNVLILIARSYSGDFLGYVRFEKYISIALSKFSRAQSISKQLLKQSLKIANRKIVVAQIKHENSASIHLFKTSGFTQIDKNADFITMEYKNEN